MNASIGMCTHTYIHTRTVVRTHTVVHTHAREGPLALTHLSPHTILKIPDRMFPVPLEVTFCDMELLNVSCISDFLDTSKIH